MADEADAGTDASAVWMPWVMLAAGITVLFLFLMGHDAIDRPDPQMGSARVTLGLAVVVAGGLLAFAVLKIQDWWGLGVGGTLGLFAGMAMVPTIPESYGNDFIVDDASFLGMWVLMFVFLVAVIGGILQAIENTRIAGNATVHGAGAFLIGLYLVTSVYMLVTLGYQAERAREAHEASALFVPVVVALLALVAVRRR